MSTITRTIAGTALAAAVLGAGAISAQAAVDPITNAHVQAHFDLKSGQQAENIVLDRNGSVAVTFAAARQVARIDAQGRTHILATLPAPAASAKTPVLGFPLTTGLVRDGKTFYVGYATGARAGTGVWKFTEGQAARKIADLPAQGIPNGMVMDRSTGALYVTDSVKGAVYRIPTKGAAKGDVTVFSRAKALASTGFLGANGVKIRGGQLYVSNLDKATILRTPLTGSRAGQFRTVAKGLTGVDDFAFTGKGNQILAALDPGNKVVLVSGKGAKKTVLTKADGLSNPTSVAVRGTTVYVPSAAYTTQKDPNLLVAHLARR